MSINFYSSISISSVSSTTVSISSGGGYFTVFAMSGNSSLTATLDGISMTVAEDMGELYPTEYGRLFFIPIDTNGIATGTYTLAFSSTIFGGVTGCYTGVNQTGQPDNFNYNVNTINIVTGSSTIVTHADNCWALMMVYASAGNIASLLNWNKKTSGFADWIMGDTNGVVHPAGSIQQKVSCNSSNDVVCVQFSLSPQIIATTNGSFLLNFM